MDKAVKELSKSASRAIGALFRKFIYAGRMTWKIYNKLHTSMVEPILFYGSGIWSISLINLSTCKCQPFLRRDAQCATFEVSVSSSVLSSLHFNRTIE
jgi:hypothetical protein